ncbi:hypothetical protein PHLCEN_2v3404 [Hermanssonia centrifuga]|uniref:Uncharacterized protein n=1 Tax=Hermanssonia centrifuga TaxID=98765 RepID=A0A2R6QIZ3_9APHY|nr:hypothetical protein PHLCEN_2v3404 [Hermanssonia centrifuga]
MSCIYLALGAVLLSATAVFAGDKVSLSNDLTQQCKFMVDGNAFNLCPLLKRKSLWIVDSEQDTPPSITTTRYTLSFNGPIEKDTTLPDDMQVATSRFPKHESEPPRVTQTIPIAGELSPEHCTHIIKSGEYYPGLNVTAEMTSPWGSEEPMLSVRFNGGYYVDKPMGTSLLFQCDPSADESYVKKHPSLLKFRVGEGVLIRWASEDLELENGEEDLMVNGANASYGDDEEQIPLKPSPRKGHLTGYGTA